jgi:hypothetical protein
MNTNRHVSVDASRVRASHSYCSRPSVQAHGSGLAFAVVDPNGSCRTKSVSPCVNARSSSPHEPTRGGLRAGRRLIGLVHIWSLASLTIMVPNHHVQQDWNLQPIKELAEA